MWRMSYPPRRPAPPPARWVAEVAPALAGLGLLVVIGLSLTGESRGAVEAPGGWLTYAGRLSGLAGTYLLLLMLLLIARIPLLERTWARTGWCAGTASWAPGRSCLLTLHALLIMAGYAEADRTGVLHELWPCSPPIPTCWGPPWPWGC